MSCELTFKATRVSRLLTPMQPTNPILNPTIVKKKLPNLIQQAQFNNNLNFHRSMYKVYISSSDTGAAKIPKCYGIFIL